MATVKLAQLLWAALFLLSHQLSENGGLVESKVRNRVQKWQQRTWKSRFGSALLKDWKTAFEPAKSRHRTRYGLSPEEEDFFTSDAVPNAYSNYHYRRLGDTRLNGHRTEAGSDRKLLVSGRPKRHTRDRSELADELKDYLDPVDLLMLDDEPNEEFSPIRLPKLGQQYRSEDEERALHLVSEPPAEDAGGGGGDKGLKEFKIVFHHRDLKGNAVRQGVCAAALIFTMIIFTMRNLSLS